MTTEQRERLDALAEPLDPSWIDQDDGCAYIAMEPADCAAIRAALDELDAQAAELALLRDVAELLLMGSDGLVRSRAREWRERFRNRQP